MLGLQVTCQVIFNVSFLNFRLQTIRHCVCFEQEQQVDNLEKGH